MYVHVPRPPKYSKSWSMYPGFWENAHYLGYFGGPGIHVEGGWSRDDLLRRPSVHRTSLKTPPHEPRGSSQSASMELRLKNHVWYGFWDPIPKWQHNWTVLGTSGSDLRVPRLKYSLSWTPLSLILPYATTMTSPNSRIGADADPP